MKLPPKLCDGTVVQVKHLRKNTIEATILTEYLKVETLFIPRIDSLIPTDYPFEFKRFHFLVKLCFATIINKA
jgi:ATP-dependent DNA helicase PIF1